jgi:general secretion pathway protein D
MMITPALAQNQGTSAPKPENLISMPDTLQQALDKKGNLRLQDASIEQALITIGGVWGVNIVVGRDVQGTVSCIYDQAPLRDVLDAILLANGYSYRAVGKSLVVQKIQDVGSANPQFESITLSITHSDLSEIMNGAQLLLSKEGKIRALETAKSILVVDYADRVASIRAFIDQMEAASSKESGGIPMGSYQRLQVMYFPVQYIPADNAREPISAVLSQAGRVASMPTENRIVVVDYASNIAMAQRVLEKIDRPVPQVRITALIYDVSLQDLEDLGFNWEVVGGAETDTTKNNGFFGLAANLGSSAGIVEGAAELATNLTRDFEIGTVVTLLQNANDARLLANPNITVSENETAVMSSVQQIPIQQLTQSELGGQLGTTAFKDVGITLRVTPAIAGDGTVKLVMEQEFSRVAGFSEGQPIVDTRIANTTVRVADRKTLVIGGLRQRSDTGEFNGIPYLKDIKFVGSLFRSRNTTVRESELLVFLTPEIVGYAQPPSHREYMAQETVNCRLARVPIAEGCGPDGNGCSSAADGNNYPGEADYQQSDSDSPQYLPPVDELPNPRINKLEKVPLRSGFGDRYRANGGTTSNRQQIQESNLRAAQVQGGQGAKPVSNNPLTRLFTPGN